MNVHETKRPKANACSVCGTALPANLPPALCPKCLLKAGLPSQDATLEDTTPARPSRTMPQPNEQFGRYRIIRQIGQGGMGAVFEAEDLENGRRLALKIMSHALDSRDTRARFLREGRLAASINHPNSVYIFGTEEIAGMPVIAMELVTGGTLQDRVKQKGPLPVTEAVDSILQVIDGLAAAQRMGILHRDVKPSNCFVDYDGKVKIGDFGLSINTAIRLEPSLTAPGAFMGTPAFASPEQLRGDELTVRSDIYAVGITFYYILTGAVPFNAPNLPQLLASILECPVESPARRRNIVPEGLSQVVLRCLDKNPDKRFRDYTELRRALLPYASTAPAPATVGKRFAAYCLDLLAIQGLIMPFYYLMARYLDIQSPEDTAIGYQFEFSAILLYFTCLEGLSGTTFGKFLMGLRVIRSNRDRPGILRALGRILVVCGPLSLYYLAYSIIFPSVWNSIMSKIFAVHDLSMNPLFWQYELWNILWGAVWTLILFLTIRKRNGFAALHDLLTGTRVAQRSGSPLRLPRMDAQPLELVNSNLPRIGPYQALETLPVSADGHEWFLGYDARLLRKVWICKMKPDDAQVSPGLKNLGRPGRLRWLNGKRSNTESWDAYEAVSGQPLANLIHRRQSWDIVRFWLLDMAEELQAAQADGAMPARLSLDRVWITADNHAKLLDFPAPGTSENQASVPSIDGQRGHVAAAACPAKRSGEAWMSPWPSKESTSSRAQLPEWEAEQTKLMSIKPQDFLRQVAASALEGRPTALREQANRPIAVPLALHARGFLDSLPKTAELKGICDDLKLLLNKPAIVTQARRLVLALGYIIVPIFIMVVSLLTQSTQSWPVDKLLFAVIFMGELTLYLMLFFALGAALLFRGGLLMSLAGVTVINRNGTPASRWRVAWRGLIPILTLTLLNPLCLVACDFVAGTVHGFSIFGYFALGMQFILTIISIMLPDRSLQDRLAGTWLVPK